MSMVTPTPQNRTTSHSGSPSMAAEVATPNSTVPSPYSGCIPRNCICSAPYAATRRCDANVAVLEMF
jgi:hypothetical protein